jgi:hypothetical protein
MSRQDFGIPRTYGGRFARRRLTVHNGGVESLENVADSITNRLLIHGRLRCGRTKDGVKIKVFVVAGGTIAMDAVCGCDCWYWCIGVDDQP